MNNLLRLFFILVLANSFLLASIGKISALRGEATIERSKKELAASMGMELEKSDIIHTKDKSKLQIIFNDNTIITMGKNGHLSVQDYLFDEKKPKAKFKMFSGVFRTVTGKIGKIAPNKFKLKTKTATIGIRGTTVEISTGADGDAVGFSEGQGSVTSDATGETKNIETGQMVNVSPSGKMSDVKPLDKKAFLNGDKKEKKKAKKEEVKKEKKEKKKESKKEKKADKKESKKDSKKSDKKESKKENKKETKSEKKQAKKSETKKSSAKKSENKAKPATKKETAKKEPAKKSNASSTQKKSSETKSEQKSESKNESKQENKAEAKESSTDDTKSEESKGEDSKNEETKSTQSSESGGDNTEESNNEASGDGVKEGSSDETAEQGGEPNANEQTDSKPVDAQNADVEGEPSVEDGTTDTGGGKEVRGSDVNVDLGDEPAAPEGIDDGGADVGTPEPVAPVDDIAVEPIDVPIDDAGGADVPLDIPLDIVIDDSVVGGATNDAIAEDLEQEIQGDIDTGQKEKFIELGIEPLVDESGNPVLDADGKPVLVAAGSDKPVQTDDNGVPIVSGDGTAIGEDGTTIVDEPIVVDAPIIDETIIDEPIIDEPIVELVIDEPLVDDTVIDEPIVELVVDEPLLDDTTTTATTTTTTTTTTTVTPGSVLEANNFVDVDFGYNLIDGSAAVDVNNISSYFISGTSVILPTQGEIAYGGVIIGDSITGGLFDITKSEIKLFVDFGSITPINGHLYLETSSSETWSVGFFNGTTTTTNATGVNSLNEGVIGTLYDIAFYGTTAQSIGGKFSLNSASSDAYGAFIGNSGNSFEKNIPEVGLGTQSGQIDFTPTTDTVMSIGYWGDVGSEFDTWVNGILTDVSQVETLIANNAGTTATTYAIGANVIGFSDSGSKLTNGAINLDINFGSATPISGQLSFDVDGNTWVTDMSNGFATPNEFGTDTFADGTGTGVTGIDGFLHGSYYGENAAAVGGEFGLFGTDTLSNSHGVKGVFGVRQ